MIRTQPTFALMPQIKRFALPAIVVWLLHLGISTIFMLVTGILMDILTGDVTQFDMAFTVIPLVLGLLLGLLLVKKQTWLANRKNLR